MVALKLALIGVVAAASPSVMAENPTRPPFVRFDPMAISYPANIMVKMQGNIDSFIEANEMKVFESQSQKTASLVSSLQDRAASSQQEVSQLLTLQNQVYKSFWITNSVYIPNASKELVEQLAKISNVESIQKEIIVPLPTHEDPVLAPGRQSLNASAVEWGIDRVQANDVWKSGNDGKSVLVGSIDTGVRGTHEALKHNWVGLEKNGWFDPYEEAPLPIDEHGHGTHTMGTIAGGYGVGVAPGVQWLSCRGCRRFGCFQAELLACGQYMLCPTDVNGENPDCSLAPQLSSNSWGGGQGRDWYDDVTKAWRAANIIPIFAAGNAGTDCSTINSPGDAAHVMSVGATTESNGLAFFSSVGPSAYLTLKPEIAAPGHLVRSAWATGDSNYATISGTSMATPHVAGVVALLLAESPILKYEEILNLIQDTTTRDGLKAFGKNCGGIDEDVFPNLSFGYGLINAWKAMEALKEPEEPAKCYFSWKKCKCQPADCSWSWKKFKCRR